jgi:hypothetical protein
MKLYKDLFKELMGVSKFNSNSNYQSANSLKMINSMKSDIVVSNYNYLKTLSSKDQELVEGILEGLDTIQLVNQLYEMKIYYQINIDPRNENSKSLYAKAVLPRYGIHQKRKYIGINYGSITKYPKGWTSNLKMEARMDLIKKAMVILLEQ